MIIECPNHIIDNDINSLFLAGGMSGDWQNKVIESLSDLNDLIILNPKRKHFDFNQPNIHIEQTVWEHMALDKAKNVCFWFTKETACPITLFEFGKILSYNRYNQSRKNLIVGCEKDYLKKEDVKIQYALMDVSVNYTEDFLDFIERIRNELKK